MRVRYGFYKDGKRKALTFSYDDGRVEDRRLVEIFNQYGLKGTFHLNSANFDRSENFLHESEITELYRGHELSSHGLTHPWLERIPDEELVYEIMEDRRRLEALSGYPVRGMSYPWGTFSEHVVDAIGNLGIRYSRTIVSTNRFDIPDNFLKWNPTCHHNGNLLEKIEPFKNAKPLSLFYVWGHSFEFRIKDNWELIETFCREVSTMEDVWFATNIEIYDYLTALRALAFSADRTMVYNPTATDVWLEVDDAPVKIPAGQTVHLQ